MAGVSRPHIASLRRIRCLSQFDDQQLERLAACLLIEAAGPGQSLIEPGSCDGPSIYLVEGKARAIFPNRQETRIGCTAEGDLSPIARTRPSSCRIVSEGPVRYFKLCPQRLALVARHDSGNGIDNETPPATIDHAALRTRLMQDLFAGKLNLPSLPDVAQRIHQAFADNLITAETIGVIIQSDPAITAKIIMVANSALYGGRVPIESLQQAVVRLGLETTRKLVMIYAVKDLFRGETSEMKSHMHGVWKHSQHVASLCRLLAGSLDGFDVEQAQLAGLVHDIGEVAILQYAQQHDELRDDPAQLLAAVKSLRPTITGMLLKKWKFGPEFVTVGQECDDWFRNPSDQPDLCDLVLIAQYHAMIGSRQQQNLPPISLLPAFAKLGLANLEIDQIIAFIKKSRDKLNSIEALLGAL